MMDHHSLQPRTWVTEGAVNFVLILLMHDTLQPDNSDHSPVSYPVQMIKVGDWRAFSDFSLHPPDEPAPQLGATLFTDPSDAVNTSWLDAAVTFIPICSGAHYFLAVVVEPRRYLAAVALDPASKGAGGEEVLYILNSKGTVGQASAAQHVFRAIRLAGGVAAAPQADISSWWTDEIDVPQQPEGHECGIYVAVFVRKILEGLRANESITTILASLKDEISDVDDLAERDTFATLILNEIVDFHATPHSRGLDDVESVPNFLQLDSYDQVRTRASEADWKHVACVPSRCKHLIRVASVRCPPIASVRQAASNELVANEAAIMARNAALPKLPPVDGARATWLHATLPKWEASLPVRFGPAPPGPITDAQLAAAQANTQALYYSKRAGSELTMLLASCAEELRDDLNGTTLLRAYMAVIGAADALIENDARIRSLPYMELRDKAMMKLPGVLQAAEPTSAELTAAMLNIPAISDLVRDAARLPHAVRRELDYSAIWRNDEIRKVLMLKNGSCSMRATLILNRIRGARKHYQLQKWSIIIDLFELKHLLGIMKGQHTQRQWVMVMKNIFTDLVEYTELHTAMSATANIFTTPARMSAISDLISNGSVTHLYTRLTLIHSFSAGLDAIYYDSSNPQDDAAKDAALAKLKEKWREILSSPDSTANIKSNLVDEVRAHNAKLIGAAQSSVVAPRRLSLRSRNSANYKPTAPIKIIARANPSPITIGGSDGSDASGQCDASDWSDGSDGAMDQTIWILPGQTMIQLFSALSHHRILILSLTTDISTALASAHVLVGAPLPNVILAIKFVLKEIPASDGKGKVRSKVDTDMSIRDIVKKRQRAAMIRLQIVDAHGNSAVVSRAVRSVQRM